MGSDRSRTDERADESTRAATRRAQILCAAETCFCEHGFHGASIAQISAAAGMSAGHIYHYFENKEAIIAAIVGQNEQVVVQAIDSLREADDVLEAMEQRIISKLEDHLGCGNVALRLEILAEAARNPRIAAIVRAADERIRTNAIQTLRAVHFSHGGNAEFTDEDIAIRHELLRALFEGLLVRGVCNPQLDAGVARPPIRRLVRTLFGSPKDCAGE